MSISQARILVTGASGQLGQLVIDHLLRRVAPEQIVALVRRKEAAASFETQGIEVRIAAYDDTPALAGALHDIDRVLLISSNELGKRTQQHGNVINAAKAAGVKLIAYTSVLRADSSALSLADEHRETEALLRDSAVPFVLLRNGWYTENQTAAAGAAVAHQAVLGCSADGLFSGAARADYAEAAAVVLAAGENHAGRVYELAGDQAYSRSELAAEIGRQAGTQVNYVNLSEAYYEAALLEIGLPKEVAALLASSDTATIKGALFDDDRVLSRLIGRPTTPLKESVAAALAQ